MSYLVDVLQSYRHSSGQLPQQSVLSASLSRIEIDGARGVKEAS